MAIDEKKIQEMVARGVPQPMGYIPPEKEVAIEPVEVSAPKKESKRKVVRREEQEYMETLFVPMDIQDRQIVYISGDTHELLIDILHVLTRRRINLSSYVENIIKVHLEDNKDVVNGMYNKKRPKNRLE